MKHFLFLIVILFSHPLEKSTLVETTRHPSSLLLNDHSCTVDMINFLKLAKFPNDETKTAIINNILDRINTLLGSQINDLDLEINNRLDRQLFHEIYLELSALSPLELRQVEVIMSRSRLIDIHQSPETVYLGVVYDIGNLKKMKMELPFRLQGHAFGRIIFRHEFDHVLFGVKSKYAGTLKLETPAFAAQYDYIKNTFSINDLKWMNEKHYSPIPFNLKRKILKYKKELLKKSFEPKDIIGIMNSKMFTNEEINFLIDKGADTFLRSMVIFALAKDKKEFINHYLKNYQAMIDYEKFQKLRSYYHHKIFQTSFIMIQMIVFYEAVQLVLNQK